MNLLLDTNVLLEVQRPAPDLKVLGWLDTVDEDRVFIRAFPLFVNRGDSHRPANKIR